MMLPLLQSITEISRVIETGGSRPVVVLGSDVEDYVCKYDYKNKLIQEVIAHQWLQSWDLPFLPGALIKIREEHIPSKILGGLIQIANFEKPAFGLKYSEALSNIINIYLMNGVVTNRFY
ncbi:hypothetical protein [Pedobacter hartonius]|uniref:Uncharacterized protein n=1 Tax=Pedobacter hartonius TaxID=425514 RepID=A0A1H4HFM6_9SPHI|nr:hypothetical protein [Pedobacter hartonius]SEB20669.1 hypothetical protein SAMN05443550_11724 [Pedobacter hartonius]